MNVKNVVKNADRNYAFLYKHPDQEYGLEYDSLIPAGDWFLRTYPDAAKEIILCNGDLYSSDREMEALTLALLNVKPLPAYLGKKIIAVKQQYNVSICDAVEWTFRDETPCNSIYYNAWEMNDYISTAPFIYTEKAVIKELKRRFSC